LPNLGGCFVVFFSYGAKIATLGKLGG